MKFFAEPETSSIYSNRNTIITLDVEEANTLTIKARQV